MSSAFAGSTGCHRAFIPRSLEFQHSLQGFLAEKSTEASLRPSLHHRYLRKTLLSFLSLESQNFYVKKFFTSPYLCFPSGKSFSTKFGKMRSGKLAIEPAEPSGLSFPS